MGKPGWSVDMIWRNDINEVVRFFESYHAGHYLVINLAADLYDPSKFNNQVLMFGFPDHHTASLHLLWKAVCSIESWLRADETNVAGVHCFAGRGRTGLVISCVLLKMGLFKTADEALSFFGAMRSSTGYGVITPSQIRYCRYFERMLHDTSLSPRRKAASFNRSGSLGGSHSSHGGVMESADRTRASTVAVPGHPTSASLVASSSNQTPASFGKVSTDAYRKVIGRLGPPVTRANSVAGSSSPRLPRVFTEHSSQVYLSHVYIRKGVLIFGDGVEWVPILKLYNLDDPAKRLYSTYRSSAPVHDDERHRRMNIRLVGDEDVVLELENCRVAGDVQVKCFHYCETRGEMRKLLAQGSYSKPEKTRMLTRVYPLLCLFRFSFHTSFVLDETLELPLAALDSFYSGSAARYSKFFPLGYEVHAIFSPTETCDEREGLDSLPKRVLDLAARVSPRMYSMHIHQGGSVISKILPAKSTETTSRAWTKRRSEQLSLDDISHKYHQSGRSMPEGGIPETRLVGDDILAIPSETPPLRPARPARLCRLCEGMLNQGENMWKMGLCNACYDLKRAFGEGEHALQRNKELKKISRPPREREVGDSRERTASVLSIHGHVSVNRPPLATARFSGVKSGRMTMLEVAEMYKTSGDTTET